VTSSLAVFEAKIRVKSARLIKSHLKNQKKMEKMWKYKTFLYKASSKRLFWNEIHNLLRRADARGSADIINHI